MGAILFSAFKTIADQHRFPPEFPSAEMATGLIGGLLEHPGFFGVVAEVDGRVVESNFLDERSHITGLGPITVDPTVQNRAIGRRLMEHSLARA
jgi:ribosomal protein S18 acetylase RimI-like enzyme